MSINWNTVKTSEQIIADELEKKKQLVKLEATRRIESKWDKIGQNNVALGIYSDEEKLACSEWISTHRNACLDLIGRPDLLELDISDDSLWPAAD